MGGSGLEVCVGAGFRVQGVVGGVGVQGLEFPPGFHYSSPPLIPSPPPLPPSPLPALPRPPGRLPD